MFPNRYSTAGVAALALLLTGGLAHPWPKANAPEGFTFPDETLERRFDRLALHGNAGDGRGHVPYSDTSWPANEGGIAVRYLDGDSAEDPFRYVPPTKAELVRHPERVRTLSPAEKFDVYRGRFDYPLVARVRKIYSKKDPPWWGICHGWVPAASDYPEPNPVTAVSPDGIPVEFGSSDIKAIIAFYYAWEAAGYDDQKQPNFGWDAGGKYWSKDPTMVYFQYRMLGTRNRTDDRKANRTQNQTEINPGALHLLLTNLLGRFHRSFSVDIDVDAPISNQPVAGFSSRVIDDQPGTEPGVARRLRVKTEFDFIIEVAASFDPHGAHQTSKSLNLQYWLDLDAAGDVVGGSWIDEGTSGGFHPFAPTTDLVDFIWRASRVPFRGEFSGLNDLYRTDAKFVTSFADGPNYTPGLTDVSASAEAASGEGATGSPDSGQR